MEELMSLFDGQNSDADEPEERKPTDYTGVIIFAITLPVLIFFTHLGKTDMGLNVGICLGVNMFAIKLRWDLRKYFWFWGVIALLLAIELPLVLKIQWPHEWVSKMTLLPIGLGGLLIAIGAIRLVEKFIVRLPPPDEEA